jgi:hypothetical protein
LEEMRQLISNILRVTLNLRPIRLENEKYSKQRLMPYLCGLFLHFKGKQSITSDSI